MLHALNQVIFVKLVDSSFDPSTKMRGVKRVLCRHRKTVSTFQIRKRKEKKGVMKQKQEG